MVSCSGFESFTLIGDEFVLKLSPSNYTFANIDLIIVKSKQRQFVFGSGWSGLRVPALEEKDLPTDPTIFNGIHFRCGTDTFPIETTFELKNSMVHSKWFYCNIPCLEKLYRQTIELVIPVKSIPYASLLKIKANVKQNFIGGK